MHPENATLVSRLFYGGVLATPNAVSAERRSRNEPALLWLQINDYESTAPGTYSYDNPAQARAALSAAVRLRQKHSSPDTTIAILTFYRGQMQALCRVVPAALNVDVLTVDACQGCEYDYVVLSTVRSNRRRVVGFVRDKQRLCVAVSRAKWQLLVLGSVDTLCAESDWGVIWKACGRAEGRDWCGFEVPAEMRGTASVYDKQQEVRQEQLAALADSMKEGKSGGKAGKGGGGKSSGKGAGGSTGFGFPGDDRGRGTTDQLGRGGKAKAGGKGGKRGTTGYGSFGQYSSAAPYVAPQEPYRPGDFESDFPDLFDVVAGGASSSTTGRAGEPARKPRGPSGFKARTLAEMLADKEPPLQNPQNPVRKSAFNDRPSSSPAPPRMNKYHCIKGKTLDSWHPESRAKSHEQHRGHGASQVMFVCECMRHRMRHRSSCLCVSVCDRMRVADAMFVW